MCGFSGFVEFGRDPRDKPGRLAILQAMGAQMARRGPDDEQVYDEGPLSLVFRRLAIVDVDGGRQPIWNEDQTMFVCVNGEIYNHRELRQSLRQPHVFRTESDSEIVLHLYEEVGEDLVHHLLGKFALVVWDGRRQRLFFARDRLGVKPLYLAPTPDGLIFGSELKALLTHPTCPREIRWDDIGLGVPTRPDWDRVPSYVKGVELLGGGHRAAYDEAGLRVSRYWSLDDAFSASRESPRSKQYYVETCRELFASSVKARLMSDVPIGAFLSGGLDSACVVASAAEAGHRLECFNALTRTTARNGDASGGRETASWLGLPFRQVLMDEDRLPEELDFSLGSLETLVWMMDSPRFDLEWLYKHELHRFARAHSPQMKVILLGQGGDEFAGGYSYMHASGYQHKSWSEFLLTELAVDHRVAAGVPPFFARLGKNDSEPVERVFQTEMLLRLWALQHHNLWHEDRTSAAEGMESRVPFLDHRLVELFASIPPSLHGELFWRKRILRDMARTWFPERIVEREKVGFYYADDMRPAHRLKRRILLRCLDAFREQYVRIADSLFDHDAFDKAAADLSAGGVESSGTQGNDDAVEALIHCMCVAIFSRMCSDVSRVTPAPPDRVPLLGEVGTEPEEWLPKPIASEAWTDQDSIELAEAHRLAAELGTDPGVTTLWLARGDNVEEEIEVGAKDDFIVHLLEQIVLKDHVTVGDLASCFPGRDIVPALTFFLDRRWIVRRPGVEKRPS